MWSALAAVGIAGILVAGPAQAETTVIKCPKVTMTIPGVVLTPSGSPEFLNLPAVPSGLEPWGRWELVCRAYVTPLGHLACGYKLAAQSTVEPKTLLRMPPAGMTCKTSLAPCQFECTKKPAP
jgi:hypothetical protein